ncbi:hypothetical protein BC749_10744 [Flavobacterium araucananum]|uniref:RiboL-PSP-HEPN domain-containing protein n=2 Tax=Flavobacterium araucananum TaxID=946678 RepID=A0A227NNV7_9FLAO|nr:hypothetical protein B0A64_22505 [Flavobacterium araucananum]PWJ97248.1 hypothetical protein BC749_10744 [Flavobacterium araucananum]
MTTTMDESTDKEQLIQFTYHYHFDYISLELKDIEAFIKSTDKFLADNLENNKKLPDEPEYNNSRLHPEIQFGSIFPDILWRTTFLHSYFRLESALDQVCKNLQQTEEYNVGLADIGGNGIFRASIYLKKVCGISEPFLDNTWSKLNDYNKLRNIFVHGEPLVDRKKGVELAKRNEGLLVSPIDFDRIALRFSKEFNLKALQTIDSFFQILKKEIQKKIS